MFGLIGENITHSYSSYIHKALSNNDYFLMNLKKDELNEFFAEKKFKGINVTIPYKTEVIKYLNKLDDSAKTIGAVNTIVNENGVLTGYNTDAFGFEKLLKFHNIDVKNKIVLILGSGGTSKTVKAVLLRLKAKEIYVVSRNPSKGQISYDQAKNKLHTQVIINTTPYGMYPNIENKSLIDVNEYPYLESVVDVIYRPFRTQLLMDAKIKGCKTASGLYMLVAQAIKASELFLDIKYEETIYRKLYYELIRKTTNIVFIGMPSTGKTTAGRNLSKILKKKLYDIDAEITKDTQNKPKEIFEQFGEEYFRDLESKKIKELMSKTGVIISTGGGSILRVENVYEILRNGYVIFLNRDVHLLKKNKKSLTNRPLLKDDSSFDELYEERYPLYHRYCDLELNNNSTQWNTINLIIKRIV